MGRKIPSAIWIEYLLHVVKKIPTFNMSQLFIKNIPGVLGTLFEEADFKGFLHIRYILDMSNRVRVPPYVGLGDHWSLKVVFDTKYAMRAYLPHMPLIERTGGKLKNLDMQFVRDIILMKARSISGAL